MISVHPSVQSWTSGIPVIDVLLSISVHPSVQSWTPGIPVIDVLLSIRVHPSVQSWTPGIPVIDVLLSTRLHPTKLPMWHPVTSVLVPARMFFNLDLIEGMKISKRYSSYKSQLKVFQLVLNFSRYGPHKPTMGIFEILRFRFLTIFFS